MASLKERSLRALLWSLGESFGQFALSFITFLVMARLLRPEDFGVAALAGVFIFFSSLLANQGFSDALVQRREVLPGHLNGAFWCNLAIGLLLAGGLALFSGRIADLLGEPRLGPVLAWLTLGLPCMALSGASQAVLRRDIRFRELALLTLVGRMAGMLVGVGMALAGQGVWSLVGQQLVGSLLTSLAIMVVCPWRPGTRFRIRQVAELWGFGIKVSLSQMVFAAGVQLLNLLIGVFCGSVVLGYFTVAHRMVEILQALISNAVYHVGFSAFSRLQDDIAAIRSAFLQSTRLSALFGLPVAAGMILLAPEIILLAFGENWAASIPLARILAIELIAVFLCMFILPLYRATGRASWILYEGLFYAAAGFIGVLAVAEQGSAAIAWVSVARSVVLIPVHLFLAAQVLQISPSVVARPLAGPVLGTLAMTAALLPLVVGLQAGLGNLAMLALAVPAGAAVYGLVIWTLFPDLARSALSVVRIMRRPAGHAA